MATILDVNVLGQFWSIFAFLFVLILMYGILSYGKLFGDSKALQALIAFLIAIFVLLTPRLGMVFVVTVPWLTVFFILILFVFLAFRMFGVSDADFRMVAADRTVLWTVLSIMVIIMLWGVVHVYGTPYIAGMGEEAGTASTVSSGGFTGTVGAVFFHPKVLGLVFLLLLAVFTIGTLTGESAPPAHGGHGGH